MICPICSLNYEIGYGKHCSKRCHNAFISIKGTKRRMELHPDLPSKARKIAHLKHPNLSKIMRDALKKKNPNFYKDHGKKTGLDRHKKNPLFFKKMAKKRHELHPELNWKMLKDPNNNFGYSVKNLSYGEIRMRSSWEIKFAELCDTKKIKWQYEPKRFSLPSGKKCLPDFYLCDLNLWVEIKPKKFQTEEILNRGRLLNIDYKVLDLSDFNIFFKDIHV